MQTCVYLCCIRGDAALCLPQWSIWKAVREMNDCRYIDYCSLPRRHLLPLSFLSAPCSISPCHRPSTSPPLPLFILLHLAPSLHLVLPSPHLVFLLSVPVCLIHSPFYRISDHVTVLYERVAFRKTRHNPPLKDSLPGTWNFQLTLQSRMYFYLLIEASIPKYPKPCC